jgi:hypothetical protein
MTKISYYQKYKQDSIRLKDIIGVNTVLFFDNISHKEFEKRSNYLRMCMLKYLQEVKNE